MKNLILLALLTLGSLTSFAGSTNDFHSLIVESAEARKSLSQKLKKSVEAVDTANHDQIERQQKVVFSEPESQIENVAVPSHSIKPLEHQTHKAKLTAAKNASKEKMERLSQEVDESRE